MADEVVPAPATNQTVYTFQVRAWAAALATPVIAIPSRPWHLAHLPVHLACLPDGLACLPDGLACLPSGLACLPPHLACLPEHLASLLGHLARLPRLWAGLTVYF